ncbi:hypothetical protein [Kamptonema formosum]|uniref:hypothetical protein n=1 Tax=Kamptonema formosum TaxID=331992 RepID=UPI0012DBD82C|nr:hypothetical protein [Oscillatoria sp. PCC 10802]
MASVTLSRLPAAADDRLSSLPAKQLSSIGEVPGQPSFFAMDVTTERDFYQSLKLAAVAKDTQ